jgi:hypothetical protein
MPSATPPPIGDIVDATRLKEWLSTAQGVTTLAAAVLGVVATVSDGVQKWLNDVLQLVGISFPGRVQAVGALTTAACALLIWRSVRRFARASRLEQPDAFTLHPATPDTLIGRKEDLSQLINSVKLHRLVLLDGESGCGKSALVSAGLIPVLTDAGGLLPVAIREWGDDWVRGPLANALDALYHALSPAERERLGWTAQPDLTAAAPMLTTDLGGRLEAVFHTLGRRALLIADQFDDYQARHRGRFLDQDGNWLTPSALAASNPFWGLVSAGLNKCALHLLVVTRADNAAGLSCVRFLGEDLTVTRTLARVEPDYLHPLLAHITADNGNAEVVSHPEGGWVALRDRIEADLKMEGAILMQQVRTVMLGLRQLALLTPKHYLAAGGLHGVETLVISRALERAGHRVGGGAEGRRLAATVLGELVLPGRPDQAPKAQRAPLSRLCGIVGDASRTVAILGELQHDEVVRPAETLGSDSVWQLDHDYLARAVLKEARNTDRWAIALSEGKAHYEAAAGSWRSRYAALLPFTTLMRLCWERLQNRLKFGRAADYALMSAVKPALVALCVALAGAGAYFQNHDRQLTLEAYQLINRYAAEDGKQAVLLTWQAPEPLRRRIRELLRDDGGQLQLALRVGWHRAHAGSEPARAQEVTSVLIQYLAHEQGPGAVYTLAQAYQELVGRLDNPAKLRAEAAVLRGRLEQEHNRNIVSELAQAYTAATAQAQDDADRKFAAATLRTRLQQESDSATADNLERNYAAVIARLGDAGALQSEAAALRERLARTQDDVPGAALLHAYQAVAARLADAGATRVEASALRTLLLQQRSDAGAQLLALAYVAMAARVDDQARLDADAAALAARLQGQAGNPSADAIAQAYVAAVARSNDTAAIDAAVTGLRARLERGSDDHVAYALARAYGAAAARLRDGARLTDAVVFLRTRMKRERDRAGSSEIRQGMSPEERGETAWEFARFDNVADSYEVVVARLDDPTAIRREAEAIRALVEHDYDNDATASYLHAYGIVAARLDAAGLKDEAAILHARMGIDRRDPRFAFGPPPLDFYLAAYKNLAAHLQVATDVKTEAAEVRTRLEQERDRGMAMDLADAYESVAARLTDAADVQSELAALRTRLAQRPGDETVDSFEKAYMAMANRLRTQADVRAEAAALRALLTQGRPAGVSAFERVYMDLAQRLSDPADVRSEAGALQPFVEQGGKSSAAETCRHVYATLAARLDDPAQARAAAAILRLRLVQAENADAFSIAQDYATVAVRLNDADAIRDAVAVVQARMDKDPALASYFYPWYAMLAARLDGENEVRAAAGLLRARLETAFDADAAGNTTGILVSAYTTVATRLRDAADLKVETAAIRAMLARRVSDDMAQAYIRVTERLRAMTDLKAEAAAMRSQLERAQDERAAGALARAYAAVAGAMVRLAAAAPPPALVSDILTLAGHPYLRQPEDLLRALAPAAGTDFGGDLRGATRWAVTAYALRPEQLRPQRFPVVLAPAPDSAPSPARMDGVTASRGRAGLRP